MNKNESIYKKLSPIFCDIFDDDNLTLTENMSAKDVDTWDSLTHIRLIVAIENYFNINFTSSEVAAFNKVDDLVLAIAKKAGV